MLCSPKTFNFVSTIWNTKSKLKPKNLGASELYGVEIIIQNNFLKEIIRERVNEL